MEIAANIYADAALLERARLGTLTASEKGKLSLAGLAAELFPDTAVYLEGKQHFLQTDRKSLLSS